MIPFNRRRRRSAEHRFVDLGEFTWVGLIRWRGTRAYPVGGWGRPPELAFKSGGGWLLCRRLPRQGVEGDFVHHQLDSFHG